MSVRGLVRMPKPRVPSDKAIMKRAREIMYWYGFSIKKSTRLAIREAKAQYEAKLRQTEG